MRKYTHFKTILISLLTLCACATSTQSISLQTPFKLVVLHTNDHHGHPLKFDNYPLKNVGGLPARDSLIAQIKKTEPHVLVLDAGDFNTGRAESSFFNAEPDIKGYNYIGYDALTLGNHEFDNSIENISEQASKAQFPFLSANITYANGFPIAGVKPFIIKKIDGVRIAIFGLTTSNLANLISKETVQKLKIEDEIIAAKKLVPILQQQADVIIALVHMGIDESDDTGSRLLAKEVPGISLIVDGHSHTHLNAPLFVTNTISHQKIAVVQAHMWGLELGKTNLTLENGKEPIVEFKAIPINTDKNIIPENEELKEILTPYLTKVDTLLGETIASNNVSFDTNNLRGYESPLGNLVANSVLTASPAHTPDFSIVNSGGIRAGIAPTKITKKTVYQVLPFDNSVVLLSLKGSEVQNLFNYAASLAVGNGAFPQVAGIKVTLNRKTKKATSIFIANRPLEPNKTYLVATNSFMAAGGDGYTVFEKKATNRFDTSLFMRDVFAAYIKNNTKYIQAKTEGRITVIE